MGFPIKKCVPIMPRNLIYCDVGARWGIDEPWKSFRDIIDLVCFEPDQEEYKSLIMSKCANDVICQYALYKASKNISLNLTKSRGCSSIYKPNHDFLKNYSNSERFEIEDIVNVKAESLDAIYGDRVFSNMDFIKIDVQGAELDILKGGENFLKDHILGVEVEVEFHPLYTGQPLFADVDCFIRDSLKLQIQDLRKTYWKYPEGINVGANKGQLIFGDALYFMPPQKILSWCSHFSKKEASNKMLMACLMGIVYGYLDYSLCILHQPSIDDFLDHAIIENWKCLILNYGKTLKYNGKGASKFAGVFNLLYRMFQPSHEGWASVGHHLGTRKKFGIFS